MPHGSTSGTPRAAKVRPSATQDASGHSFSGTRGGMKQDAVRLAACWRETLARETEIEGTGWRIAERETRQPAIAGDGMQIARYGVLHVVEP